LLSGHDASAHQAAVFDAVANATSGSKIIKSVAGSGKTTVIKNALRYMPAGAHVQGLAFNVEAANNLKAALAEVIAEDGAARYANVRMGTFHSVGMYAIVRSGRAGPRTAIKVDAGKCRRLLRARLGEDEFELYNSFVCTLVGLAKGEGIGALVPDTDEQWWKLVEHHGLYLDSEEADEARGIEIARKLLTYSNACAAKGDLDYNDQLYLVILWKLRLWQNDIVFVDEVQDTNPTRRAMLWLLLRPRGRLFAVGDPCQSIYGFTGATTDAMDIIAREFNAEELPLTVSYRCAQAVVEHAQQWVDYIEASSFAPVGRCEQGVELVKALEVLTATDAVLCRQTAPLVTLAYKLIAKGRAVRVAGKEIGEGLVNLVHSQRAKGIDRLVEKLQAWCDREVAKFRAKGDETRAEGVEDRTECVMVIIANLPETKRTIPALVAQINGLFEDNGSKMLTLSTVHKAKGQEWDTVAILRPDLMPSKGARQQWQLDQEINLMYVAATRAKTTLLYLDPNE
jgi:superfamily I DNA/RNA helicase